FAAFESLNTARATTIPTKLQAITDEFASLALDYQAIAGQMPAAGDNFASAGNGLATALRTAAADLIIQTVYDDNPQLSRDIATSLAELIRQMIDQSETVEENVVSTTPTVNYDGANIGNSRLLIDGYSAGALRASQNLLAETLTGIITGATSRPQWLLTGQEAAPSDLDGDWPLGSGASASFSLTDPKLGEGLLGAANFETGNADNDYLPDGWIVVTGTPGAAGTIRRQKYGTSTVAIAGSPTTGTYELILAATLPVAKTLRSAAIPYDATASELQAILRLLPGLEQVTVTATGTSPNLTHTIQFVGAANVTITGSVNNLDAGTVTPTNTVASGQVYRRGGALLIHGNGSEQTRLLLPLSSLKPNTSYGLVFWGKRVATASGALRIGIAAGDLTTASYDTYLPATWTTSFAPFLSYLYTSDPVPDPAYLSVHINSAMTNGHQIAIDNLALVELTELYTGGPLCAAVIGGTPNIDGDRLTIDITNDRAGKFQEMFQRFFDMRGLGLQLPSAASSSETIADSLIA
ncbi:MAG: hypothetical protein AB7U73_21380, partial [Pirellulales bacterium]